MLLLARSALCIGLVVAALPEAPSPGKRPPATGERLAAVAAGLCGREPAACLGVAGALAPALTSPRAGSPRG